MVCFDRTIFEGAKNLNIEKIIFKVVQINILAMHDINNTKIILQHKSRGIFVAIANNTLYGSKL